MGKLSRSFKGGSRLKTQAAREIYELYPRHLEPREAIKEIELAIMRLCSGEAGCLMSPNDAELYLKAKTEAYSKSPAGKRKQYVKYPCRWFKRSCYLEDPSEWQDFQENPPDRRPLIRIDLDEMARRSKRKDEEAIARLQRPAVNPISEMLAKKAEQ